MTRNQETAEVGAPALAVEAVSKIYGAGTVALSEVSLAVEAGETLALVGESGSGKTTLLRMFNRLVAPTSGVVRIAGRAATELDPITLRRQIGYVAQDGGLLPHWPVARNVELVPKLLGWERGRREDRARKMLELVGLGIELADRYPGELSGGQRQRVALARALAADPSVILLDEPFGALDALTRLELHRQFLDLKRRLGKTMVLVTHDLGEAFRLADRIAVMRGGHLLQIGPPAELAERPATDYVRALLAQRLGLPLEGDRDAASPPGRSLAES